MTTVNRQIRLAARPVGLPRISDFTLDYSPTPSPAKGEVLVRSVYLSLDPASRRRLGGIDRGGAPIAIGEVLGGCAVGVVVESATPSFTAGDVVTGMLGWQEHAIVRGDDLRRLDPALDPVSIALGILGTPGLTAYFGLLDVCAPRPGETVVVSGASGGIGMLVGQIAKIHGCRAVGLSASEAGSDWLVDDLGFDAATSLGTAAELAAALDEHCPRGVDVYFDNVGGATTDAVVSRINKRARIAICGQSSQDNLPEPELARRWLDRLVARQAKMEGFVVSAYADRFPEALAHLQQWLHLGRLKYREDVSVGLESAPQAFIAMLEGRSQGKQLVQVG